ncbi:MAG TPA: glycosyltransferase, partial [Solirubrobacteraceae bacterium]|nr:glycosyltransferase [Solirubrobacteraceae bacterium]
LGRLGGDVGWRVQRLCARLPQRAFCFSRLYAARLREEGLRGEITMLAGLYNGPLETDEVREPEPVVVFAGRHIPEKQVPAILPALVRARERVPGLRASILGDGPDREEVIRRVSDLGLDGVVEVPGFVAVEAVEAAVARALCMLLPSRREGYGLVVIEAAASGTPSIVVAGPDNAAVELISEDENGFIAPSASPEDLAAAIVRVHAAGTALRDRTAAWFASQAARLSLDASLDIALAAYGHGLSARS